MKKRVHHSDDKRKPRRKSDSKKKSLKSEKDNVLKPSRPITEYIYFSTEIVPKLKAKEGISHKDAMSRAGEIWKKMADKEK